MRVCACSGCVCGGCLAAGPPEGRSSGLPAGPLPPAAEGTRRRRAGGGAGGPSAVASRHAPPPTPSARMGGRGARVIRALPSYGGHHAAPLGQYAQAAAVRVPVHCLQVCVAGGLTVCMRNATALAIRSGTRWSIAQTRAVPCCDAQLLRGPSVERRRGGAGWSAPFTLQETSTYERSRLPAV